MEYRKLGGSELSVSEIGLGCMSLSGADVNNGSEIIYQALDMGVNYLDTADLYGRGANETLLGKALSGIRHQIVLATKVGNAWKDGVEGWTWDPSRSHILSAVDASLRRLGTDYIDLYQLHGGTIEDNFEDIIETFELLVQQGKIRYYGISSIRPNVFNKYLHQSNICSNMMQYSLLDTRPEEYFAGFEEADVSIIARGSLAQGLLLDKSITGPYLDHTTGELQNLRSQLKYMAADLQVSEQALALRYCLEHTVVGSALVGIRTSKQLDGLRTGYDQMHDMGEDIASYFSQLPTLYYRDHRS